MVEEVIYENETLTIDGKEIDNSRLSAAAISQLKNMQFVNEQILQKNNELQIADSARLIYSSVLKNELKKDRV